MVCGANSRAGRLDCLKRHLRRRLTTRLYLDRDRTRGDMHPASHSAFQRAINSAETGCRPTSGSRLPLVRLMREAAAAALS